MLKTIILGTIAILICMANNSEAKSADICRLPMDKGICTPTEWRYHFDPAKNKCFMFPWGCLGNANNFKTRQECKAKCM
uniref:Single Kunitz protease inhibitor n=1 Tax=Simulium vittatum TaxID=7192 RepID=B5M0P1_SIMVI|nr:single Kunitz protease inhibitor [Simulium vittatum]